MKSIVFLDIDGVMNCRRNYLEYDQEAQKLPQEERGGWFSRVEGNLAHLLFDKDAVERLNRITRVTGAQIVLSSSWRRLYERHWSDFLALAKRVGIEAEVLGHTTTDQVKQPVDTSLDTTSGELRRPPLSFRQQRGDEIAHWLENNLDEDREAHVLVLDDDSDMDVVKPWFVQTSFETALADEHVDKCIEKLRGRTWRKRV